MERTKEDERPGRDNPPLFMAGGCDSSRGEHYCGRQ